MNTLIHEVVIDFDPDSHANVAYRAWLEEHAGAQGRDWWWDLVGINGLMVIFREVDIAIQFKLTFGGA